MLSFEKTLAIIEELSKQPKDEIEYAIYTLLLRKVIDYPTISKLYVNALEKINQDNVNFIVEGETCILEHLINLEYGEKGKKKKRKFDYEQFSENIKKTIQRSLYFLNRFKRFNMGTINEKFHYNEEEAKKLSWYERNKEYELRN
jgi:hypothetical protein